MSFLFKFLDSGLLLTLGLILLISGGIMLYCYRRLNLLEKSVIEHGKILHNFILNYNVQMQNLSILNKSSLYETKNDVSEIKKINLEEKIAVSDNETDDESDNETDDESENESCSDEKHDTANESTDESDTESDNESESIHNGITISENKLVEDISNLADLTLAEGADMKLIGIGQFRNGKIYSRKTKRTHLIARCHIISKYFLLAQKLAGRHRSGL